MAEVQETTFFEQGNVKVTNARFIVPSQTYAMSGITSVKFYTEKPSLVGPVVAFLIVLVALAGGRNVWVVGIPLAIGILLLFRRKKKMETNPQTTGKVIGRQIDQSEWKTMLMLRESIPDMQRLNHDGRYDDGIRKEKAIYQSVTLLALG